MLRTALAAVERGGTAVAAVLPEVAGQLLLGTAVVLLAYGPGRRLLPLLDEPDRLLRVLAGLRRRAPRRRPALPPAPP